MFPPVSLGYQTLYAELAERSLDAAFSADFSVDGRFIRQESRGRTYWYFDTSEAGSKKRLYVGPVDDPEISQRVENFKRLKADARARRKLVSTLVREAHLPRPEQKSGDVVQALAEAGFFRLRGVLIGTVAYQCYSALLAVRLPQTEMQTADADFAQFHAVSVGVADTAQPLLEKLREVDSTFREIPHRADGRHTTQLVSSDGYRIDFLTPNTSSDDYVGHPVSMPALGGMSAEPLWFLDFLIHEPERAAVLHKSGVPVLVPAADRFAVHKLVVATRRLSDGNGVLKSNKDRIQARALMLAMIQTRQTEALADAFMEAWDRGPHWQNAIRASLSTFDDETFSQLRNGLADGIGRLDGDVAAYGLVDR